MINMSQKIFFSHLILKLFLPHTHYNIPMIFISFNGWGLISLILINVFHPCFYSFNFDKFSKICKIFKKI